MKTRLFLLLTFLIVFSANAENLKLKAYKTFVQNLDTRKFYSNTIALSNLKSNFSNENIELRDSAFVIFDDFYNRLQKKLNEIHLNDETDYLVLFFDIKNGEKIKVPELLLKYRNDLNENGFDIAESEGLTWIKKNRDFISKNLYDFISPQMKDYCSFLNTINNEGTEDDGSLSVSPTRLAERVIWLENFKKQNSKFHFSNDCNLYYKHFLYLLLNGTDHKSVLNDKDELEVDFLKAYNYVTLENSKTETSKIVLPFYELLKSKNKAKAYDLLEKYNNENIIAY